MTADRWFRDLFSDVHPIVAARRRTSAEKIRVAVLDSGVDMSHPLLAPHLSRIREVKDWTGQPGDRVSHGTFVAALVLSVAPNAEIYVAKVFESTHGTAHTKRYVSEVSISVCLVIHFDNS
jgi:hypothetical protein